MIGLRSQFGPSLVLVALIAAIALPFVWSAARRASATGGSLSGAAARVLAGAAVMATIVATALPRTFGLETDGDLVLGLGRGGLGEWRILFDDPTSLASIELLANVLLYVAVGFTATLGWFRQRRFVLPACLALSVLIEAAQYGLLGRVAALDDVVLNGAGALIGYLAAVAIVGSGVIQPEDPTEGGALEA